MAKDTPTNPDLDYADTLWKAADTRRGQVDAAFCGKFATRASLMLS